MRCVHNGLLAFTAACFLALAGAACDNTARGVKQDTSAAKDEARDKSEATKEKTKDVTADAKRAAGNAGAAIDAATETLDVKSKLMADSTVDASDINVVDASDINVDTFHETKTVVLKGSVPTAAQKEEAGRIAAREATGYKIDNQLTVKPHK